MALWTSLFEWMIVVMLIYTIIALIRNREYRTISELAAGILFGFTLEYANVFLFKVYTYNTQFLLQLGQIPYNIPLSIAMAWGLIIINTHRIIKRYNLSPVIEIFAEALLGFSLDLVMDIIAIRLDGGFWNWLTTPLIASLSWESLCGVPWGNYYGWFCVLLIASVIFHIERKKISSNRKGLLLLLIFVNPIITTICLLGFLMIFILIGVSGFSTTVPQIFAVITGLFIGGSAIFVIIKCFRIKTRINPSQSLQSIVFFVFSHLFFIIAAIVEGIFVSMWGLIFVEAVLFGLAIFLDLKSLKGPKLSFFK